MRLVTSASEIKNNERQTYNKYTKLFLLYEYSKAKLKLNQATKQKAKIEITAIT